jgi:pimeloyl-ACP methyl ester carboxylesterase
MTVIKNFAMKKNLGLAILFLHINIYTINAQYMKTENVEINSEKLSYFDSKKGNITLLFIHGAFINKEYWSEQVKHFSQKYRVITIDLAGHGNSSHNRSDWTLQNYGKDIREFIKALSLKNIILIGHSIGADIMLETVTSNSSEIIGLIGVDYFKNVGSALPKENIDQIVTGLKTDFANSCEQYARQALLTKETNHELTTKIVTAFRAMNPEVGIPLNENCFKYTQRETELLKALTLKLYLINVNYFPTNEESLKKYIGNNYELNNLNGTCHYPMLEVPNQFNSALEKILSEIKEN